MSVVPSPLEADLDGIEADRDGIEADLGGIGGYFAFEVHPPGSPAVAPWHPMRELVEAGGALGERIAATRAGLASAAGVDVTTVETRVAASVAHLGLSARLISIVLGATVTTGQVPDCDLEHLWWQPVLGGPFPLSMPSVPLIAPVPPDPETLAPLVSSLAALVSSRVLDGPVTELVEAVSAFSVSRAILWGNVASALHGALAMFTARRPAAAGLAHAVTDALFDTASLRGTSFTDSAGQFRRRSCCLIYRIDPRRAQSALCGDCVLGSADHHTSPSRQSQVSSPSRSSGESPGST